MLNRSLRAVNPGKRSPHELFYGVVPRLRMLPFLRPGYCRVGRERKMGNLSGGAHHPSDSFKAIMASGAITHTRDLIRGPSRTPFPSALPGDHVHVSTPERGGVMYFWRSTGLSNSRSHHRRCCCHRRRSRRHSYCRRRRRRHRHRRHRRPTMLSVR